MAVRSLVAALGVANMFYWTVKVTGSNSAQQSNGGEYPQILSTKLHHCSDVVHNKTRLGVIGRAQKKGELWSTLYIAAKKMVSTFSLSSRLVVTPYCVPFTSGIFLPLCGGQCVRRSCINLLVIHSTGERPAEVS